MRDVDFASGPPPLICLLYKIMAESSSKARWRHSRPTGTELVILQNSEQQEKPLVGSRSHTLSGTSISDRASPALAKEVNHASSLSQSSKQYRSKKKSKEDRKRQSGSMEKVGQRVPNKRPVSQPPSSLLFAQRVGWRRARPTLGSNSPNPLVQFDKPVKNDSDAHSSAPICEGTTGLGDKSHAVQFATQDEETSTKNDKKDTLSAEGEQPNSEEIKQILNVFDAYFKRCPSKYERTRLIHVEVDKMTASELKTAVFQLQADRQQLEIERKLFYDATRGLTEVLKGMEEEIQAQVDYNKFLMKKLQEQGVNNKARLDHLNKKVEFLSCQDS